jgi:hypothetical protein
VRILEGRQLERNEPVTNALPVEEATRLQGASRTTLWNGSPPFRPVRSHPDFTWFEPESWRRIVTMALS